MLPTGFRTFHFVSFLYVFFLFFSFSFVSFLFSLFCFLFFAFRVFRGFFSLLFSLFSFRLFSFLFVFFSVSQFTGTPLEQDGVLVYQKNIRRTSVYQTNKRLIRKDGKRNTMTFLVPFSESHFEIVV